jgi:hypothetical protein
MNQKDKGNMRRDWAFVIFATILSFLINIVSIFVRGKSREKNRIKIKMNSENQILGFFYAANADFFKQENLWQNIMVKETLCR